MNRTNDSGTVEIGRVEDGVWHRVGEPHCHRAERYRTDDSFNEMRTVPVNTEVADFCQDCKQKSERLSRMLDLD